MKFTAFGSIIALALIGVAAAAPPNANPGHKDTQPSSPGTTSAHHDTHPSSPDGTTPHKTDPTQGECTPSKCKTFENAGEFFCGNEGVDPGCLDGHKFKSNGDGTACDLGLDGSCRI